MLFLCFFAKNQNQNQNQINHYFPFKKTSKNMKLSFPKVMPRLFVIIPSLFGLDFERGDFIICHPLEIYLTLYNNSFFSCCFVLILQKKKRVNFPPFYSFFLLILNEFWVFLWFPVLLVLLLVRFDRRKDDDCCHLRGELLLNKLFKLEMDKELV
jgi:hypothetical protein